MTNTEKPSPFRCCWLIVREVIAVLLWLFVVLKLIVFDIDLFLVNRVFPSVRTILDYKLFIIAPLLATILLLFRGPNLRNSILYISFYPIIVIFWKIPKFLLRNWPLTITFTPAVHEIIRSFRITFAIYSFAALSSLFVLKAQSSWILIPSMIFLFIFLGTHLVGSARKAYRSSIFSGLADMVKDFRSKLESRSAGFDFWKKVECPPTATKETNTAYEGQLTLFYCFNWGFELVTEKLNKVARSRKIDLYLILSWLWTFSMTALVYAFEYYSLQKLIPDAFSPTSQSFWAFLGFSFGKLLPSGVSTIAPVHSKAILLCYSQLVCGLMVLIILFFTFLTVARERYREDINNFICELRLTTQTVEKQFVAVYEMALSDVELILISRQGVFINKLRQIRGLPELEIPKDDKPAP